MSDAQRTIPPTARKLRDARAKGQVPRSKDLNAASSWIATCVALVLISREGVPALLHLATRALEQAPIRPGHAAQDLLVPSLEAMASLCAIPIVAAFATTLVTGIVYTGPTLSTYFVAPRLDRLSPTAGLKRILAPERWVDAFRDLVKLAVIVALGAAALGSAAGTLFAAPALLPIHAPLLVRDALVDLAMLVGAGALAFALVDAPWSWHRWIAGLRMTPAELTRELKETEGDPAIKGQRRRLHREIAENRMVDQVRRSTVVIVNPTHVAVALRWDEDEMDAPTVMATGKSELARRIIAEARRAGVPVVHDTGLAHSLAELTPGETIPEVLYDAVAAVIRVLEEREP